MKLGFGAVMVLATLAIGACGSDSGSAYEGIYEVQSWTMNAAGCDAAGEDILGQQGQTIFYVKRENFLGVKFLNVKFCDDVADCEALASEADTIHLGSYGFDLGGDSDGWRSEWFSGFADMDVCDGTYYEARLTGTDDGVRVEVRGTPAGGFAPDADGFCEDEPGKQAADGQPCGELEVFTATQIGDLP